MCFMTEKLLEEFVSLLEAGGFDSYEAVCRKLRVCPDDLDETLLRGIGFTGEEVFDEYFGNRC